MFSQVGVNKLLLSCDQPDCEYKCLGKVARGCSISHFFDDAFRIGWGCPSVGEEDDWHCPNCWKAHLAQHRKLCGHVETKLTEGLYAAESSLRLGATGAVVVSGTGNLKLNNPAGSYFTSSTTGLTWHNNTGWSLTSGI